MIHAFIAPQKLIDLTGDLAEVTIEDIAGCLSLLVRFNGALGPLSVCEHSLAVADYAKHILNCTPAEELAALLHDAHEAFIGDITRPALALLGTEFYERVRQVKKAFDRKLEKRFGLPERIMDRVIIAQADEGALAGELLLGHRGQKAGSGLGCSAAMFLERFLDLQQQLTTTKGTEFTKGEEG